MAVTLACGFIVGGAACPGVVIGFARIGPSYIPCCISCAQGKVVETPKDMREALVEAIDSTVERPE